MWARLRYVSVDVAIAAAGLIILLAALMIAGIVVSELQS